MVQLEKREDIQIYVLNHKPVEYGLPDNSLYTPLQVGGHLENLCKYRDNSGTNISSLNPLFAEWTGIYWIWKNSPRELKYVGQCQYRRRLEFAEDTDFDEIFKDYDVIACEPLSLGEVSVFWQYGSCHCVDDIIIVRECIQELYPDLVQPYDSFMKEGRFLFYSNGFIMKREDYLRYCDFVFSIFQLYMKKNNWNSLDHIFSDIDKQIMEGQRSNHRGNIYQRQIFGFLSERLLTFYLLQNYSFERIKRIKYHLMENTGI